MASRNIAITEDLYIELSKRKHSNESFTKVISRLLDENEKPSKYYGIWADLTPEEKKRMKAARQQLRDEWEQHRTIDF
jgi:predicted CopG family antitoxin